MDKEERRPRRGLRRAGLIVIAIIFVYALSSALAMPLFFGEFGRHVTYVAPIPALWSGFIPQGVTRTSGDDLCMICGYRTDGGPSCIFRIGLDASFTEIRLEREDGSAYSGHAGGMTAFGKYVYISNASKIFVLDAAEVSAAQDGDTLRFIGSFDVPCRASFCSSDGAYLYVGEYHADGYETAEDHRVETADSEYQAMVFGYRLDSEGEFGIADISAPELAYAVPDIVQGFAIADDGTAALSCSAGLKDSHLLLFNTSGEPDGSFALAAQPAAADSSNGQALSPDAAVSGAPTEIPLYILDSRRACGSLKMPHMSEDLEFTNGAFRTLFEAGALKFGAGFIPTSVKHVVSLDVLD